MFLELQYLFLFRILYSMFSSFQDTLLFSFVDSSRPISWTWPCLYLRTGPTRYNFYAWGVLPPKLSGYILSVNSCVFGLLFTNSWKHSRTIVNMILGGTGRMLLDLSIFVRCWGQGQIKRTVNVHSLLPVRQRLHLKTRQSREKCCLMTIAGCVD